MPAKFAFLNPMPMHHRITLGTAQFGSGIEQARAFDLLDAFYASGGRQLDTAHVYASWLENGTGASERCLGRWIAAHNRRSEMYVATKGAHPDLVTQKKRIRLDAILADLADSLERLQSDYIDLYFLHRDDISVPIGEIAQWMHALQAKGSIRGYGLSNWRMDRIDALIDYCAANKLHPPIANQIGFSLAQTFPSAGDSMDLQLMDSTSFAWHQSRPIEVYAYSSQANGLFAKCNTLAEIADKPALKNYNTPANAPLFGIVREIADAVGATPVQISLAALLHTPFPCSPIIGARSPEQLAESLAAAQLTLTPEQLSRLFAHWQ